MPNDFESSNQPQISVVTPTLRRPDEIVELLENLKSQKVIPSEVIIVDGAPDGEDESKNKIFPLIPTLPYSCKYIRHGGGTAIQRNVGIEAAQGEFIAFIDDDIRLEPEFFSSILEAFGDESNKRVGGIVGYRTTDHFALETSPRWKWYKRLRLFTTYEPGRYDFLSGYPINVNLQAPFQGVREVDFMTTSCTIYRREIVDDGLRFDTFFSDYGILEDAHFSLRASRNWTLLQCGAARCAHLHSPGGRAAKHKIGYKSVVNYYYVFNAVAAPLSLSQKFRFWRFQLFEFLRIACSAITRRRMSDVSNLRGRLRGYWSILSGTYNLPTKANAK